MSPNVSYFAKNARRKLVQMPLAAIGVGTKKMGTYCIYLVEKNDHTSYRVLQTLLNKTVSQDSKQHITKNEVKELLYLAESEAERERLRYSIVRSSGISSTESKKRYGFCDMNKRIERVQDGAQTAQNIMESMEKIAHLKEKGLLDAFGIELSSGSSESETDSELTDEPDKANRPDSNGLKSENDDAIVVSTDNQIDTSCNKLQTSSFKNQSEEDISTIESPFEARAKVLIKKSRESLRRKVTRNAKRKIAEERLLKRSRSRKVSKVLQECPDIGKAIEDFVEACGAGADAWRRTGVITLDGNKKMEKKATFKRVKEHVEEKYPRKISYGSVVQLCIARNKRRSAARYRGVAKFFKREQGRDSTLSITQIRTGAMHYIPG